MGLNELSWLISFCLICPVTYVGRCSMQWISCIGFHAFYLYLSPVVGPQLGPISEFRLRKSDLSIQIFVSIIRLLARQTSEEHLTDNSEILPVFRLIKGGKKFSPAFPPFFFVGLFVLFSVSFDVTLEVFWFQFHSVFLRETTFFWIVAVGVYFLMVLEFELIPWLLFSKRSWSVS